MKQERVIAILDFYRDIDKTVTMNERVIRNLEDQYYRHWLTDRKEKQK